MQGELVTNPQIHLREAVTGADRCVALIVLEAPTPAAGYDEKLFLSLYGSLVGFGSYTGTMANIPFKLGSKILGIQVSSQAC